MTGVLDEVQEEFLQLKFNSPTKEDLKELDLEMFWIKYLLVYSLISHQAPQTLAMFRSTYLYETAFSPLVTINTESRDTRLNAERNLRCALSDIQPCTLDFVAKKQCQIPH